MNYSKEGVFSIKIAEGSNFESGKVISEVVIYGLPRIPKRVTCLQNEYCKTSLIDVYEHPGNLTVLGIGYEIPHRETKEIELFKVE